MASPLDRLYRTKLVVLAMIFMVFGLVLLVAWKLLGVEPGLEWLAGIPLSEIGSALFTTGLIVVGFEYVDRRDADERALGRLREILTEQAPMLRDTVIQGFAVEPETLAKVASPATLDQVVRNSLAVQLGDNELANEVYEDIRAQVVSSSERWREVDVDIMLTPWVDGQTPGDDPMFVATVRWEYRTTLSSPVVRLACVSDLDEYRSLLSDPTSTLAWYFEPVGGLDAGSEGVFELLDFRVDGMQLSPRRARRNRGHSCTVDLAKVMGLPADTATRREVSVAYTYRVLVQQHSHVLQLDIARPSRGVNVRLAYGGTRIRHVNVMDYFGRATPPRILTTGSPSPSVEVATDGWVWPKSGIAFGWVLDDEFPPHRQDPAPS